MRPWWGMDGATQQLCLGEGQRYGVVLFLRDPEYGGFPFGVPFKPTNRGYPKKLNMAVNGTKIHPGKWKHGPKPAQPLLFNFEPHPYKIITRSNRSLRATSTAH